jgi:hypothetical protein
MEMYVERPHRRSLVGNVQRSCGERPPGMDAAFVDIGGAQRFRPWPKWHFEARPDGPELSAIFSDPEKSYLCR